MLLGAVGIAFFWRARIWEGPAGRIASVIWGLLFVLAAGEEISWGQRIIGFESSAYFLEHNEQDEFNFHNLELNGRNMAETIFGPVLNIAVLSYLIGLPLLFGRFTWVRSLVDRLAIPVPPVSFGLLMLGLGLSFVALDAVASRVWEVHELIFSGVMMAVVIWPLNPVRRRA